MEHLEKLNIEVMMYEKFISFLKRQNIEFKSSDIDKIKEECFYDVIDDVRIKSEFGVEIHPIPNTQSEFRQLGHVIINTLSHLSKNEFLIKISYLQEGFYTKDNKHVISTKEVKTLLTEACNELKNLNYSVIVWYGWAELNKEIDSKIIVHKGSGFDKLSEFDKYCSKINLLIKISENK